jgi:hypothetical protein
MTRAPATTRATVATSGSWRTWFFAVTVTVTGSLVMVGSIALAQLASGSVLWEGNR